MESRDRNNFNDRLCNYKDGHYWLVFLVIITLVVGVVLVYAPRKHGMGLEDTEFEIKKGQSLGETARLLAEQNLIISRYFFVVYAILGGHEKDFKAGNYLIPQPVNTKTLVYIFSRGLAEPEDIVITIPEGTNIADTDKILAEAGVIKAGEFLKVTLPDEGYLFPDTYRLRNHSQFAKQIKDPRFREAKSGQQPITNRQVPITNNQPSAINSQVDEIIQKMEDNFKTKTAELFKSLTVQEIKEIVVFASMLEKEVRTGEDMRLVAGIIKKRLELGMALEIDAAVAYGVCYPGFLVGKYCDVSLANIVDNIPVDSAYNTYKRRGLPTGPISNPGLRAINAALNPQPSDYLFYLSAKDGTTIFSKTAVEHLRARKQHLNI